MERAKIEDMNAFSFEWGWWDQGLGLGVGTAEPSVVPEAFCVVSITWVGTLDRRRQTKAGGEGGGPRWSPAMRPHSSRGHTTRAGAPRAPHYIIYIFQFDCGGNSWLNKLIMILLESVIHLNCCKKQKNGENVNKSIFYSMAQDGWMDIVVRHTKMKNWT